MDRENLAKAIFTHVKNNDNGQVEKCLKRGDTNSWRDIVRYEIELLPLFDNVLKDNKLVYNLLQCTINSLSPLHLAALLGHTDILVAFFDMDIPVDSSLQTGSTCLHLASFGGHIGSVKLLLNVYNADASKQDKYGWTALHYASIEGNLELIKQLVQHGVDANVRDKDGTCAALRAKWRGHEDVVTYFCSIGEEDELLNIDEDILNQNTDDPPYSTSNKSSKSPKSKENNTQKSPLSKKALEQNVPAPAGPSRTYSLPAGVGNIANDKRRSSSGASGALHKSQTLPGRFKEARLTRIRRVIRHELESAFSDYEEPLGRGGGGGGGTAGPVYGNASTGADEDRDVIMAGVGVRTMTRLMREEIQKYRDNMMTSSPPDRNSPIIEVENEIYEDHYQTLDQFGPAPLVPPHAPPRAPSTPGGAAAAASDGDICTDSTNLYKSFVPPPLPPRNKTHGGKNHKYNTSNDSWDMNALAESLKLPGQPTNMALDKSIKKLSQLLGNDWKKLAKALPLAPQPEFVNIRSREIERMFLGNSEKQAMVMLIEWRLNNSKIADVDALILGLRKCGMKDKITQVEKITQEFTA